MKSYIMSCWNRIKRHCRALSTTINWSESCFEPEMFNNNSKKKLFYRTITRYKSKYVIGTSVESLTARIHQTVLLQIIICFNRCLL